MASHWRLIRFLTIVGGCSLVGCATDGSAARGGRASAGWIRLVANPRPVEPDIPLPVGFRLVDRASEDHRSAGFQRLYLRHEYVGEADKYAVRSFYREQMPLARWRLLSDANVKGDFSMRFQKATESCTIQITDRHTVFSKTSSIKVLVVHEEPAIDPPKARNRP